LELAVVVQQAAVVLQAVLVRQVVAELLAAVEKHMMVLQIRNSAELEQQWLRDGIRKKNSKSYRSHRIISICGHKISIKMQYQPQRQF
jgi:hypothetical protein